MHRCVAMLLFLLGAVCFGPVWAAEERLTNEQVIEMVKAGLATDLVMKKVRGTDNLFDDAPDALIRLKKEGVPDEIIELMLEEADKRRKSLRSKINLQIQHLTPDNRSEVRQTAFLYLSQLGGAALPELREKLSHARPAIRAAVARALGRMGDARSAEVIRLMLVDTVPEVRHAAAEALWHLKDKVAIELARDALTDGVPPLSGYIRFLGYVRDGRVVPGLRIRLMESEDPETRAQAAWALGEIGQKKARVELEHVLLKDRTAAVRKEAATALGKLTIPETAESLMRLCRHDNSEARIAALRALGRFPAKVAVPFLIEGALLHNRSKLNPPESEAVLGSLRKLTHQDFGNDPERWRRWWSKNRDRMEAGIPAAEGGDLFAGEEGGQGDAAKPEEGALPAPPAPPPLPEIEAKEEGANWTEPAEKEETFGVVPRHARASEKGAQPPAEEKPATAPKKLRSDDLPDMPPAILPPAPDEEGAADAGRKGEAAKDAGALRAAEPPEDDPLPPPSKKDETKDADKADGLGGERGDAAEPPGMFEPEGKSGGKKPAAPAKGRSLAAAAMQPPAYEPFDPIQSAGKGHPDMDLLGEIPGVVDLKPDRAARGRRADRSVAARSRDTRRGKRIVLATSGRPDTDASGEAGLADTTDVPKGAPSDAVPGVTAEDVASPGPPETEGSVPVSAIEAEDAPASAPRAEGAELSRAASPAVVPTDATADDAASDDQSRAVASAEGQASEDGEPAEDGQRKTPFWRSLFRPRERSPQEARDSPAPPLPFTTDAYDQD